MCPQRMRTPANPTHSRFNRKNPFSSHGSGGIGAGLFCGGGRRVVRRSKKRPVRKRLIIAFRHGAPAREVLAGSMAHTDTSAHRRFILGRPSMLRILLRLTCNIDSSIPYLARPLPPYGRLIYLLLSPLWFLFADGCKKRIRAAIGPGSTSRNGGPDGCLPLWFASGSGGMSRQTLGTVVIGGMLGATLVDVLIVHTRL